VPSCVVDSQQPRHPARAPVFLGEARLFALNAQGTSACPSVARAPLLDLPVSNGHAGRGGPAPGPSGLWNPRARPARPSPFFDWPVHHAAQADVNSNTFPPRFHERAPFFFFFFFFFFFLPSTDAFFPWNPGVRPGGGGRPSLRRGTIAAAATIASGSRKLLGAFCLEAAVACCSFE